MRARIVDLPGFVVTSHAAEKSSDNGVSNLMSSSKTPSSRQELASRRRRSRSPGCHDQQRREVTVRKEILWESDTATNQEVNAKEIEFIRLLRSNDPAIGYNRRPHPMC